MVQYLIGSEPESFAAPSTQVYKATHEGGGQRLPFAKRSFISFSFGGKVIEDFNLIAYTEGDSISRALYGNFEDITENYETIDGQLYWGTHFTNNELALNLVTDSIDDRTLDDFKQWFKPGIARELILSEHPNRAIMARVSAPPTFSMMVFEKKSSRKIAGVEYNDISVTEYKGTIQITFTMDEPYWHSRYNVLLPYMQGEGVLGVIPTSMDPYLLQELIDNNFTNRVLYAQYRKDNEINTAVLATPHIVVQNGYWYVYGFDSEGESHTYYYPDEVLSLSGGAVSLSDKDFLKIILEDNIPHTEMIKGKDIIFGEEIVISENENNSRIFNDTTNQTINGLAPGQGAKIGFSFISYENVEFKSQIDLNPNEKKYLYYAGTAPSKPIISFTFIPTFDDEGFIVEPYGKDNNYSYLAIDDNYFYFTTPSILTSYNQVLTIIKESKDNEAAADILQKIKDKVSHYYVRAFATQVLNSFIDNEIDVEKSGIIGPNFKINFCSLMKLMFYSEDRSRITSMTVSFNSATGEAKGIIAIQTFKELSLPLVGYVNAGKFYLPPGAIATKEIPSLREDVGDMVKSKYLTIEGRNRPNLDGYVTSDDCHVIHTNYSTGLKDVKILYRNMYY